MFASDRVKKSRDTVRRRNHRRGEALVETSLVLLCLLATLLGILDVGHYLFFQQAFRERVRAGARYAIVHNYDTEQITNMVLYNSATAPGEGHAGLFGLTADNVSVTRHDQGTPRDRIEVTISDYPIRFYSFFMARTPMQPVFRAVLPVESLGATD